MEKKLTKQVIVINRGLKVRRGKEIAQGGHSVMSFITRQLKISQSRDGSFYAESFPISEEEKDWLENSYTKICVSCDSEAELDELYAQAQAAGLTVHMVVDSGMTEFKGVPTKTAIAIGPHYSEKIDKITGHLKLY